MRVIGIDPGSRSCGFGIVDSSDGEFSYVASGSISLPSDCDLPKRLRIIHSELLEIINKYKPGVMSIEGVFFAKNAKSAIKLGQARGVAILAAAESDIKIIEYSPTQIKHTLTGKGRANKEEIQRMLAYMLGIDGFKSTDESDAIAIAICHINLSRFSNIEGIAKRNKKRRNKRFTLNDITT